MTLLPGGLLPGGLLPGADDVRRSTAAVDPQTHRTADFLTAGHRSAEFDRALVAATFERADSLVVR